MARLRLIAASIAFCAACIVCQIRHVSSRPRESKTDRPGGSALLTKLGRLSVLRFEAENNDGRRASDDSAAAEPELNVVGQKRIGAPLEGRDSDEGPDSEDADVPLEGRDSDEGPDSEDADVPLEGRDSDEGPVSEDADVPLEGKRDSDEGPDSEDADAPGSQASDSSRDVSANEENHLVTKNGNSVDDSEYEDLKGTEQLKDAAEEEEEEEEFEDEAPLPIAEDDSDVHNRDKDPFFGSPCKKFESVPGAAYRPGRSERRAEKLWQKCGDIMRYNRSACHCYKTAAACCANLTSIPDMNATIRYLDFSSNNLTQLDDVVLQNWTHLKWLILNRNAISVVTSDSLHKMTVLQRFELAYNEFGLKIDPVNFTAAVNGVNATLTVLAVNYTEFSQVPEKKELGIAYVIRHLRLANLSTLFVDGGRMRRFDLSDLRHLPNLSRLSLKSHLLQRVFCCSERSFNDSFDDGDDVPPDDDDTDTAAVVGVTRTCVSPKSRNGTSCRGFRLHALHLLNLDNNTLLFVPSFCNVVQPTAGVVSNEAVLPNLRVLSLAINAVIDPESHQFQCLRNVRTLVLTGNPLRHIEKDIFKELSKLHRVDLR